MEKRKLTLSISPHINSQRSVTKVMFIVILTLLPALFWGFYLFGKNAVLLTAVCIISCMAGEMFVQLLRKRDIWVVKDLSAVLTGILLAMILTPSFSLVYASLGSLFAIIVGKCLFGGLGYNIFNPALIGRAFLQMSFPLLMTSWTIPKVVQAISEATPLALGKFEGQFLFAIKDLFFGFQGGCIGETSAFLLLIGGLVLAILKIIDYRVPVAILSTVAILAFIFSYLTGGTSGTILYHLFSGGLIIGTFFMATDMVTSPITPLGNIIFGVGIGAVVMVIRVFGGLPEGVMFSILFMNAFVPLINRHTKPKIFGEKRK
jgi:Na+-translocating ferredoxin:NAD+ oxidoreductase subunit D